jgi:hypothetical protein
MAAQGLADLAGNDVAVRSIQLGAQLPARFPATPSAVTQATNRATGVTLNALTGQITTNNASLAAGAQATFTVTNSFVSANDIVLITIKSGTNSTGTDVFVSAVAAGSFSITVDNNTTATAETGAIIITFAVVKVQG